MHVCERARTLIRSSHYLRAFRCGRPAGRLGGACCLLLGGARRQATASSPRARTAGRGPSHRWCCKPSQEHKGHSRRRLATFAARTQQSCFLYPLHSWGGGGETPARPRCRAASWRRLEGYSAASATPLRSCRPLPLTATLPAEARCRAVRQCKLSMPETAAQRSPSDTKTLPHKAPR